MKITEPYELTIKKERILERICDKCNKPLPELTQFEERYVEIECTKGYSYPDNGASGGWCVEDLCDDCVEWLRNLLESNGVRITNVEADW